MQIYISLFSSILLGVIGQVFIKKGLNLIPGLDFSKQLIVSYLRIIFSPFVLIGLTFYFMGVFFWLYALSKVDLSFAFPFVSLSYIVVIIFSWIFLGESISLFRWAGVFVISFGVFLISRS